jgi:hypothetical protein
MAGVVAVVALAGGAARGSPNVPLDDPAYDALDRLALAGALPAFRGGFAPLSEARLHELVPVAPEPPAGAWLAVTRAALVIDAADEFERDYATPARPRSVAGAIALSCERRQGGPCGNGAGAAAELDAAAGYGASLAAAVRLRARTGTGDHATALDLDRAYLRAELGPVAAELGRDAFALGPAAPTALAWGDNAPPLDHVRLSTARPLALSPRLRASVLYLVGRLAAPQTYPDDLVTIARAQLDIAGAIEIGAMQLLQLGGDGAPGFGAWDFVLEHVARRDASASLTDSSNRRVGLDVAVPIDGFGGARITYQLMFDDLRRYVVSAVRYDADHALAFATRWLTVELRKTGVRAYEHTARLTGFTTGGRIVGDPLGPAAQAVRVAGRIPLGAADVMPWAELAEHATDTYDFPVPGPIAPLGRGPHERRLRIGARAHIALGPSLALDPEAAVEAVEDAAFVDGARRTGAMFRAALVWRPAAGAR